MAEGGNVANPIEWLAWIYGKWFVGHAWRGFLALFAVACTITFVLLGVLWLKALDDYADKHPKIEAVTANNSASQNVTAKTQPTQGTQVVSSTEPATQKQSKARAKTHKANVTTQHPKQSPEVPTPLTASQHQTPTSQLPSYTHSGHGFNLSACVHCSVTNSQVGDVKVGPGPLLLDRDSIQGQVVCAKKENPSKDMPNDCQYVAVTNSHIGETTAAFENTGKAEGVFLSGNVVQPPLGGPAQIVKNDPGGEMKDVTAVNNQVGPAAPQITQDKAFSVRLSPIFWNPRRDAFSGWWLGDVTSNGPNMVVKEIHPANVAAYVTATNLQSVDSLIEYYELQAKTTRGQWVDLPYMNAVGAAAFLVLENTGLKDAHLCTLDPLDKSIMAGKIIKAGQIFRGWVFFEYPEAHANETFLPVFRFRLHEFRGTNYTSPEQSQDQNPPQGELQGGKFVPIQSTDLSRIKITFLKDGK
jgi:hypothetical protein